MFADRLCEALLAEAKRSTPARDAVKDFRVRHAYSADVYFIMLDKKDEERLKKDRKVQELLKSTFSTMSSAQDAGQALFRNATVTGF